VKEDVFHAVLASFLITLFVVSFLFLIQNRVVQSNLVHKKEEAIDYALRLLNEELGDGVINQTIIEGLGGLVTPGFGVSVVNLESGEEWVLNESSGASAFVTSLPVLVVNDSGTYAGKLKVTWSG